MRSVRYTMVLTVWALGGAQAQAPGTDIYVAPIRGEGATLEVGAATNVTTRPGYDNQPSFTRDGDRMFYTATSREGQTEIWYLGAQENAPRRLTNTAESEYSPTLTPDGRSISVIRVEVDSSQRLWRFPLDGGSPSLVFPNVEPVGYHAWGDATTVAMFVLGDPPTLQVADTRTGAAHVVASNIGRSLHKVPGRQAISFLHRTSADEAWITLYDLDTEATERVAPGLSENEFYAWTPDGTLISGAGSELFRWSDGRWLPFADLSDDGVSGISRIAVNPNGRQIAIVAADP